MDRDFNNRPIVFVRAKIQGSEQPVEQIQYRICHINTVWKAREGFQTKEGVDFKISQIPKSSTITTKVDRVMFTPELFIKVIDEILNIDNWALVEVDPTEHWPEQSFNWTKAFDKFFEESQNA